MNFAGSYEPLIAFLMTWTAKATVLLGLGFIAALLLRRQSAALRHRVWAIAIAGSLALPVASLVIPAWHLIAAAPATPLAVSQATIVTGVAGPPPTAIAPARDLDTETLVGAALRLWALGTVFVGFRLLAGLVRLRRTSAYSKRAPENACAALAELRGSFGIRRKVRLLESGNATTMPMTWGIFHPTIVLPIDGAEWDDQCCRIVLSHELAHVGRNDWLLQICAETLRACFWFHPLAWAATNRLRLESERACDDAVLNSGIAASEYANQLLALAQSLKAPRWRFSLALAIARSSNLERRFAAMLDPSISRGPISLTVSSIAIVLGACLLLPLAGLTLSAEAPPVQTTAGIATPKAAAVVLPYDQAAKPASALLRTEDQSTTRQPTARRLSGAETKAGVISAVPHTNDAPARRQAPAAGPIGSISGTVGDPSGATVPHALVSLTDIATGQQEQVTAGDVGEFTFSSVIPDSYKLSVAQRGFKPYDQTIQLFPGEQLKLAELLLSIGDIAQEVTVSASRSKPAGSETPSSMPFVQVSACSASTAQVSQPAYKNPVQPGPPPSWIRVGGMVEMARLVQQTMPIYPAAARAAGMQGTVVLNGIIGKGGTLLSTCVANGPALLAQSAFDAVSQWRYSPVLLNGEPVEALTQIGVVFKLTD